MLSELMGGTVGLESKYGEGSTFWFTVLLSIGKVEETVYQSEKQLTSYNYVDLQSIKGSHILIAEDNDENQLVAQTILENEGFICDIACNGEIAVDMVKNSMYELILMDMRMPVMDGVDATKIIRIYLFTFCIFI